MPRDATTSAETTAIAALRARVRALELSDGGRAAGAAPFGAPEVDCALPWGGLPRAALHEIVAGDAGAAAPFGAPEGFAAALAARLIEGRGPALWCLARGDLHGPGLGAFGLDPDRLIVARARNPRDVPWAMEEGLRSGIPGAVLGEPRALGLAAGRRLQLAARTGGVACLVLRQYGVEKPAAKGSGTGKSGTGKFGTEESGTSVAVTRWRVAAVPSLPRDGLPGLGPPRWRVGLVRCRGGVPHEWFMEWNDEARHFTVVPVLAERAAGPARAPLRRAG